MLLESILIITHRVAPVKRAHTVPMVSNMRVRRERIQQPVQRAAARVKLARTVKAGSSRRVRRTNTPHRALRNASLVSLERFRTRANRGV